MGGRCYILEVNSDGSTNRYQGPRCTDNFQIVHPRFRYLGLEWHSVEQAFQALKFPEGSFARNEIQQTSPNIGESDQEYGLRVWALGQPRFDSTMRDDWEQVKVKVMLLLNLAKYESDSNLQNDLRATGNHLIESKSSTSNWKQWNECTQKWIREIIMTEEDLGPTIDMIENLTPFEVETLLDS